MSKSGKKYTRAAEQVVQGQIVPTEQALSKVKELTYVKFDESVDVDIVLGIDPSQGDQTVRGSVVLPHGRGKKIKVLVFAKGDYADAAQKAGADYVGAEDLVEKIQNGWLDFNYAVATPDLMGMVGTLAKFLGPRGLLPNKKLGTVTFDVDHVVRELKKGQVFFKNDKNGLVHFSFGKVSFDVNKLQENLSAFVKALLSSKPASSKGKFLKKMVISSTMGVGIQVSPDEVLRS
jgi:large subunit ribosomal protein L1